jgi:cell division protein FtsX
LVLGVLIVSGAFGLLLGAVETAKVTVDEDLAQYWRTTYDILVRPPGSRSLIEEKYGLVQANHLSNLAGGIVIEDYEAIADIPGVEVAAPIAMLGFFELIFHTPLDVYCEPGFYRLQNSVEMSDGLREYRTVGDEYFYCTEPGDSFTHLFDSPDYNWVALSVSGVRQSDESPWFEQAAYRLPVLLAAVDPVQENQLMALDRAMIEGEYLAEIKAPTAEITNVVVSSDGQVLPAGVGGDIPLILNARSYVSFTLQTEWQRINLPFSQEILDQVLGGGQPYLAELPTEWTSIWEFEGQEAYQAALAALGDTGSRITVNSLRALPTGVTYREISPPPGVDGLVLEAIPSGSGLSPGGLIVIAMPLVEPAVQMSFRESSVGTGMGGDIPFVLQGVYDIERLPRAEAVSEVPLETYFPPQVILRYDETGNPALPVALGPTFSDNGYFTSPPLALTTLEAGTWLSFNREAPISAIRVRVAGVEQFTPEARARIEAVAAAIIAQTGLDVDITVGSSPKRTLVHIPGDERVPAVGYVEEGWIQKGLSYTLTSEIKRVNVLLFSVMLVVSALYILNTSLISTLARQREIALQKALGWRSGTVFVQVLSEGALVGMVAGTLGLVLALLLTTIFDLDMPLQRAVLILPLGVMLCLLGSLLPAIIAARIPPAQELRRGEVHVTGVRFGRLSLPGYALRQAVRRRARAGLAIMTIAISTGLMTLFLGVIWYAHGYLSGTLLGEYILQHIGGFHFIIAGVSFVVSGLATADVLLMSIVERRREMGVLKSIGWRNKQVLRLFLWEAVGLALVGGLLGGVAGVYLYWHIYRASPLVILGLLGPALLLPVVVSLLAAIYPAWQASRVPPAEAMRYE